MASALNGGVQAHALYPEQALCGNTTRLCSLGTRFALSPSGGNAYPGGIHKALAMSPAPQGNRDVETPKQKKKKKKKCMLCDFI